MPETIVGFAASRLEIVSLDVAGSSVSSCVSLNSNNVSVPSLRTEPLN